jgi:hypothetical protein
MKKILMLALPFFLLLSSCRKDVGGAVQPIDEGDWIYRERGVVVASDYGCPYFVVEAEYGYSVLKSWDGAIPYQGSVIYGDFSSWGVKRFYNRSERYLVDADVREYSLGYYDAIDEMDYQCNR